METIFHFIFELMKISILASIYAALMLFLFKIIGYFKPDSWFDRITRVKTKFWLSSGLIIFTGFFFYMFTYFGDHGISDSAKIPIGYFKKVRQINGADSYLQNSNKEQLGILNFAFDNNQLYAETQREFNGSKGDYVVWDLRNDHWTFYRTKADYLVAAQQNNYPMPDQFKEFEIHYNRHWYRWRFWLLP